MRPTLHLTADHSTVTCAALPVSLVLPLAKLPKVPTSETTLANLAHVVAVSAETGHDFMADALQLTLEAHLEGDRDTVSDLLDVIVAAMRLYVADQLRGQVAP